MDITDETGKYTYFEHEELACPSTGEVKLAPQFPKDLLRLRESYGFPMTVTSCCRSAKHNKEIGGHPRSLHVYDEPAHGTGGTCAIDIARPEGIKLRHLIQRALLEGWTVGIADTFVHLDKRSYIGKKDRVYTY